MRRSVLALGALSALSALAGGAFARTDDAFARLGGALGRVDRSLGGDAPRKVRAYKGSAAAKKASRSKRGPKALSKRPAPQQDRERR